MAKVKLQWKPPKELANDPMYQYDGALDVLAKVYRQDGITGWYRVGFCSSLVRHSFLRS